LAAAYRYGACHESSICKQAQTHRITAGSDFLTINNLKFSVAEAEAANSFE